MSTTAIVFNLQLVLGYLPWLFLLSRYVWPKARLQDPLETHRAIATLHSFRFFGLVFLVPGVVGAHLPGDFAAYAAYGDFAAGVLAMLALMTAGIRPLFWALTVAFNVVGIIDLLGNYYHGVMLDLPSLAGELGATYIIPIVYVPVLMITHVAAFYLMARQIRPAAAVAAGAPAP